MSTLGRKRFQTKETWLEGRKNSIGASEAAAVLGISPFLSNVELWRNKTGNAEAKDLRENAAVAYGVRMEPVLRELFAADHPELEVAYHPFDLLFQDDSPHLTATLDGELTEKGTGRKGILEIKTVQASGKRVWDAWRDAIPQYYYAQICHQLNATGFAFCFLYAMLKKLDGDMEIRAYRFEREECAEDMAYLKQAEERFWRDYVLARKQPPRILPQI